MIIKGEFSFLKDRKHVISLVGAGGKTTLLYALAEEFSRNGIKTVVTTTTHIYQPEESVWARNTQEAEALWNQGSYAVVGVPCKDGKLTGLSSRELDVYMQMADTVLIEADGAKGRPCKVPADHEPVIPKACDLVIGVMGMSALGKPLQEVCFRKEEAVRLLKMAPTEPMTTERMARILAAKEGTRKNVGSRKYYVVLNQCDSIESIQAGEQILRLLREQGIEQGILTCFRKEQRDGI